MKQIIKDTACLVATFFVAVLGAQLLFPPDSGVVRAQENILNAPGVQYEEEEKRDNKKERENTEAKQRDEKSEKEDDTKKEHQKQPEAKETKKDDGDKKEKKDKKEHSKPKTTYPDKSYIYEAQHSDSYSQMARKAIQTYGVNNDINLSQAEILMAETNLTLEAGSPYLHLGQKVAIEVSVVAGWMEKAQDMSAEQEAAWAQYLPGVNFNTNSVGEAS